MAVEANDRPDIDGVVDLHCDSATPEAGEAIARLRSRSGRTPPGDVVQVMVLIPKVENGELGDDDEAIYIRELVGPAGAIEGIVTRVEGVLDLLERRGECSTVGGNGDNPESDGEEDADALEGSAEGDADASAGEHADGEYRALAISVAPGLDGGFSLANWEALVKSGDVEEFVDALREATAIFAERHLADLREATPAPATSRRDDDAAPDAADTDGDENDLDTEEEPGLGKCNSSYFGVPVNIGIGKSEGGSPWDSQCVMVHADDLPQLVRDTRALAAQYAARFAERARRVAAADVIFKETGTRNL